MKKTLIYIFVLLAVMLAACAPATGAESETGGETTVTSDRCGDASQLADTIYLYNWVEYIDPAIKDQFLAECGVEVVETNFDSNETLLATLQAGGAAYDVIVPSDYMVQILISEGYLMEIDKSVVTNLANMNELNVNQYFDPEQKYTVPYLWGTSGFAVDTTAVPDYEASWRMVFEPTPENCGKISMLDDQRETLGAALMYLGYSLNSTDPAELEEAKNLLIAQAECVRAYDSQTNDDLLITGETVFGHMWTGDAILAGLPDYGGRDGIVYVIPEEGCVIWQDNLAVPVGAPNAYTAMVFINYLHYPEIAAQNAEFVGYGTPNQAAKEFISEEVLADPGIYPPAEVEARLQWLEDVGDALQLYDRIWTEFKASVGS
ncbi:MAG TPA: spermidine/putrescine ABC transporter substrate-binding protein [Anaerolineae bacterium]|mgnify:FL=1|nr:spermidine/putrescine ABC transporter substrate-binding protein [Anaerolineae bacterium]HRJ74431.1 spermidine/putrescine ABC transporter substrate-binding protein [Anaerolineales bacterium]